MPSQGYAESSNPSQEHTDSRSSWSMEPKDGGFVSTPVGTTFYMAPELLIGQRIAPTEVRCQRELDGFLLNSVDLCSQKIDIYSLGITFFEMCYPFNTSMERAKILSELRRSEIHVPNHFRQKSFSRHVTEILFLQRLPVHSLVCPGHSNAQPRARETAQRQYTIRIQHHSIRTRREIRTALRSYDQQYE